MTAQQWALFGVEIVIALSPVWISWLRFYAIPVHKAKKSALRDAVHLQEQRNAKTRSEFEEYVRSQPWRNRQHA